MLQESLSQFIQFELWFSLIKALISRYWLSKAPCCAEGIGASAQPISTPGFEMIKRVSYLSQEWEVRGWMMSEMQTHSRLNTAWDVENERQRGTWKKEEASHRKRWLKSSRRLGRGGRQERAWGSVYERQKKKGDYLKNFCEAEALACSTCLDIVLTTMPTPKAIMMRFTVTRQVMYLLLKKLPEALFVLWYSSSCSIAKKKKIQQNLDGMDTIKTSAYCATISRTASQ